jgi:ribonuclease P protein component
VGLPQANRLKHRRDFEAVYKRGKRYGDSHLTLISLTSEEAQLSESKFGISISLKVSKRAVIRNRLKRQIRAALRSLLGEITPGWRVIIIVKPKAIECKYEHFLRELKELLIKARIINGHS